MVKTSSRRRCRWPLKPTTATTIVLLAFIFESFQRTNQALFTNIYSAELSELSGNSRRFLIAPASAVATTNSQADTSGEQSQLASQWRQNQQQQRQRSNELALQRLTAPTNEPTVADSVVTDFPNPNINNLGHEITKILKKFFLHGYDKRVRPNYSGPPALVNVSFHIIGISSVDEVQMDFTTDFYFRQEWFDPRLEFNPVGDINELCVGAEFAEKIWLPDTFFANEKTATFHKATTENTFIRIGSNGRVYRSIRLTVTCSCPMDLQYFPMDRQRCKIEIESYGYNTRDIDYRWQRGNDSVSLNTKIELPQFKILGFKMGQEIQYISSGDYIRLYCEIHFVRSMGYYLIQIYIPASLIVMISWVSFWLHRNATPARVALGVTTVLTMTTLMSSTNAALPKISYIKSIDVFLGTCFVMVFASLLEYASVGYIGKRIAMKRKRLQNLHEMQQHHQKVCVAAAASAAAAAAAQEAMANSNNSGSTGGGSDNGDVIALKTMPGQNWNTQTLKPTGAAPASKLLGTTDGSKTMQKMSSNNNNNETIYVQRLPKADKQQFVVRRQLQSTTSDMDPQMQARNSVAPLVQLPPPPPPLISALSLSSHGPTTEFEVSQTHDMIRIWGLTPSAIDKHSRVVFPICFVCFNLMYWIIYGHISQQTEDKGSPLIPFIRS